MRDDQITVMCVDDHAVVLDGLALIIEQQLDMKIVALTTRGEEAVVLFMKHRPDITLMDLRLPDIDGVRAITKIRESFPEARIIVLTMYPGDQDIYRALQAGAAAYLLKDTLSKDLVRVIRDVHARRLTVPAVPRGASGSPRRALTKREEEIILLIAEGMGNREIATQLGVSEETVHTHLKNIFEKLGVDDRTHAVTLAIRRGIIHL